mmetsp:Transcript_8879/g.23151  ORF Transcript_8879/g.23151 Transcript_8879/m.23151 type:complete len:1940 (-) Transcript_8879:70-5889(-)
MAASSEAAVQEMSAAAPHAESVSDSPKESSGEGAGGPSPSTGSPSETTAHSAGGESPRSANPNGVNGKKHSIREGAKRSSWSNPAGPAQETENPSRELKEGEDDGVDWQLVLTNLQREKKRNFARQEEHYVNRSLFCLVSSSQVREAFINVAEARWFSFASLSAILVNCVFMVYEDPVCTCSGTVCTEAEHYKRLLYKKDCTYWDENLRNYMAESELVFTILFTLEMIIKVIARGFFMHKHAYLRDTWNWIDFTVVIFSIVSLWPSSSLGNVQVLRTVRVLRPLRTMTQIQGMRPLINTFVGAFKNIVNVVSLLMFFFVVFGILGTDLLSAGQRGRCYVDPPQNPNLPKAVELRLKSQQYPYIVESLYSLGSRFGGVEICSPDPLGKPIGGQQCDNIFIDGVEVNTTCSVMKWCNDSWCMFDFNENPMDLGWGYVSYDNIGSAFITIFQALTNEGWTDLMYRYENGWSVWGSRAFHSTWVIIGAFFVIQLALAVLADSFVQAQEDAKTEKEREALHDEAILRRRERKVEAPKKKNWLNRGIQNASSRSMIMVQGSAARSTPGAFGKALKHPTVSKVLGAVASNFALVRARCRQLVTSQWFGQTIVVVILLNTATMMLDHHDQLTYENNICRNRCAIDPGIHVRAIDACTGPLFERAYASDGQGGGERPQQTGFCYLENDASFNVAGTGGGDEDSYFVEGSRYGVSRCSDKGEDECEGTVGGSGMPCRWTAETTDSLGAAVPGRCKMMLYNATNFAERAETGFLGNYGTISLRHLCGVDGSGCGTSDAALSQNLEDINLVLTYIFIAEMALKMLGLGLVEYFSERFNQFDFLVVMTSIVDVVVTAQSAGGGSSTGVSSLRGMRLLRLFKLARSWSSMRKILNTLGIALGNLKALTIVWGMFMYIFALLCMQFCGGNFKFVKTENPRSNFDSFGPSSTGHGAFLIVFQIISTENWNTILYNSMQINGGTPEYSFITIGIVLFGNYIIMNLFISILLQGFDEDDEFPDNDEPQLPKTGNTAMDRIRKMLGRSTARVLGRRSSDESPINEVMDKKGIEVLKDLSSFASGIVRHSPEDMVNFYGRKVPVSNHKAFGFISRTNPVRVIIAFIVRHAFFDYAILCCIFISSLTLMIERPADSIITQDNQCPAPPAFVDCRGLEPGQIQLVNCPQDAQDDDWNRVYGQCGSAEEHPCCQTKAMLETFVTMDQVFTIIFLIEMFFKMIADGVVLHGKSYFRDAWNWLDFIIVVVSMISTYGADDPTLANIKFFKSLRALRALRPLRVIKRNPGLKIVVVALLSSIPAMLNVAVVFLLWFSMYAMLGTQLFKGKLYSCMDHQNMLFYGTAFTPSGSLYTPTTVMSGKQAVPTIIECASRTQGLGTWDRKYYSFDYYHHGLLTLFEMATTEGWMDVMAATTDMTEVGVTPIPNFLPHAAWYSVLHIVVGAFVLLNLIVGSIINNYNRIKSTTEGIPPFLTPEQQEWKETRKLIVQLKPILRLEGPRNPFRRFLFDIANHPYFEWVTTSVIVANVLTMTLKTHDEHDCFTAVKVWINISFTIIFILEAVIKIIALGPRWYVRDGWNVFDFSVAILSCVSVGFDVSSKAYTCDPALKTGVTTDNVPALQVLRAFRIARVFRLVRRARGLRNMIQTLIVSIPALGNIMGLIGIFTIIFAVLGNTLFFNVSFDQDFYGRMDPNANYQSFDNAIFLLLRQTTGEVWNNVMYYCSERDLYRACGRTDPPYLGEGCGGPEIGPLFHLFWQLFGTYLMMQLFTAVIIENFDDVSKEDSSFMPVDRLNEFVDVWTELDPEAKQRIPSSSLPLLIMKLKPPLGINAPGNGRSNLLQVIKDLAIPIRGESVMYRDTFLACVKRVMAHDTEDDEDDEPEELDKTITGFNGQAVTIAEDFAARLVQRAYRDWREKRMQVQKGTGMTKSIPLSMENLPSRVVNW